MVALGAKLRIVPQGAPVLVVDDDGVSRQALVEALEAADLACVGIGSGSDALQWLARQTPSLVVIDLVMPEPDGYAVLRAMRSRPALCDIPVVVMTGLDSEDEPARAFASGADDFIRKPVRPAEVIARIRGQL